MLKQWCCIGLCALLFKKKCVCARAYVNELLRAYGELETLPYGLDLKFGAEYNCYS